MTIIVTKPGIIVDAVGSYFYDKKSGQKMGFSSWAGRRHNCMTFFGPSMTEKNHGRSKGEENIGEFAVTVGGWGPSDARFSRTYARVCQTLGSN